MRRLASVRNGKFDWKEIAIWFETEGSAYLLKGGSGGRFGTVRIGQNDKSVIEDMRDFLNRRGFSCKVRKQGRTYMADLRRQNDVERFLKRVRRYLRTNYKREQANNVLAHVNRLGVRKDLRL